MCVSPFLLFGKIIYSQVLSKKASCMLVFFVFDQKLSGASMSHLEIFSLHTLTCGCQFSFMILLLFPFSLWCALSIIQADKNLLQRGVNKISNSRTNFLLTLPWRRKCLLTNSIPIQLALPIWTSRDPFPGPSASFDYHSILPSAPTLTH